MIYLNIFLIALLAFAISMICGGGAGLLLIPILGYVLPASQVPAALTIGTTASSITKIFLLYQKINWKIVKNFLPFALPGALLGAWLLSYLAPMYVELCMAIFLVSNLPYLFRKEPLLSNQKKLHSNYLIKLIGVLAGFISALTGAVGVLFNGFYLRCGLEKEEIVATRAANEIFLHIFKLMLYGLLGLFSFKVIYLGVLVAASAVIATFLMKYVLKKIPIGLFSKFGYSIMIISGAILLNSAVIKVQDTHNPSLDVLKVQKGYDAYFNWSQILYTIEFKYDEGFEFERSIPLSELDYSKQIYLKTYNHAASKIIIEKVYAFRKISYEAYFYNTNNQLIDKLKFD